MSLLYNLLIGFSAAFVGTLPPGLINMYASKVSMKEGRKRGFVFALGVSMIVMLQVYVALIFARYIDKHPEIVEWLQKIALAIFIALAIYFIFIAKDTRREVKEEEAFSKTNRFFRGMFIASLNVLPIPYWVYIGLTFAGFGWFSFSQPALWGAVIASGIGTLGSLSIYIHFFKPKEQPLKKSKVNMNYIIGFVTGGIAIITFLKIMEII